MNTFLSVPRLKLDDESVKTETSTSQILVETKIEKLFELFALNVKCDPEAPILYKQNHLAYVRNHLFVLPENYQCLDSSRPWFCYWLCQSFALLNCELTAIEKSNVVNFLSKYAIIIFKYKNVNHFVIEYVFVF